MPETTRRTVITLTIASLILCPSGFGKTIYVQHDASGLCDGTNWNDAFNHLQDALVAAEAGDEIWVAEGVYRPDQGGHTVLGDRTATFRLISGVGLYGGFSGYETQLDQRDWMAHETVLSGDLNEDDLPGFVNNDENSYTVVTGVQTDLGEILDGFAITSGNTEGASTTLGYPYNAGGGVRIEGSRSTLEGRGTVIANCTFTNSFSQRHPLPEGGGGALAVVEGSGHRRSGLVVNCSFVGNGIRGLGSSGGAIYTNYAHPTLIGCTFLSNEARYGGAAYLSGSRPVLINCVFQGNNAMWGGAIASSNCRLNIVNCTFNGNTATEGGALHTLAYDDVSLSNCVVWDNPGELWGQDIYLSSANPSWLTVCHCDITGGRSGVYLRDERATLYWLEGNIDVDPLFAGGACRLPAGSPCVDAGDDSLLPDDLFDLDSDGDTTESIPFDYDYTPRILGVAVDMGAYETIVSPGIILDKVVQTIVVLPPKSFHNANSQTALQKKIEAIMKMIEEGLYEEALHKLENDILKRTDGCANQGEPDSNDWVITCDDQNVIYPLVIRAIELVEERL